MARPLNNWVQVNGKTVERVWQNKKGFYIRNPLRQGADKREFFAKLDDAVRRRDKLAGSKPLVPHLLPREEVEDELLGMGIPPETPQEHPEIIEQRRHRMRLNPDSPDKSFARNKMLRPGATLEDYAKLQQQKTKTKGGYTLAKVGRVYRDWYANEREDVPTLKRRAKASKGRRWISFATPTTRRTYRESERYFSEFVVFLHDKTIDLLTGTDFKDFYERKRDDARKKGVENPNRWMSHRFKAVKAAFRRARKINPDEEWPPNLNNWLEILECKGLASETRKTLITPAEFHALLAVVDAQWRAILLLAMNAALANTDVSEILWKHVDLDESIMWFPRPKTGRLRQTPLAPETMEALRAWRAEAPSSPNVFLTWQGTKWVTTTNSITKHWDILRKQTGQNIGATFKALRKTAASTVMSSGITNAELAVEMLLGHCPNKTWRYYVGFAPVFLHEGVNAIRAAFFEPMDAARADHQVSPQPP